MKVIPLFAALLLSGYVSAQSVDETAIQLAKQVGAKFIGRTADTGSMVPTLNTGDRLIWLPVKYSDVKVGDIVICAVPYTSSVQWTRPLVAHRVVKIDGRQRVWTKGDALHKGDPDPVNEGDLRGILVYAVAAKTGAVRDLRSVL